MVALETLSTGMKASRGKNLIKYLPVIISQIPHANEVNEHMVNRAKTMPIIRILSKRSDLVRLKIVFPLFCISLVSRPANITKPKHHFVFLSMQPLSSILSLSIGCFWSSQKSVPSNLVRLLLGGSQTISPAKIVSYTDFKRWSLLDRAFARLIDTHH